MDPIVRIIAIFCLVTGVALVSSMLIVVWKLSDHTWTTVLTAVGILMIFISIFIIAFNKPPTKPHPETEAYELALIIRDKKQRKINQEAEQQREINYQRAMEYYKSQGITLEPVDNRQLDYLMYQLEQQQNANLYYQGLL